MAQRYRYNEHDLTTTIKQNYKEQPIFKHRCLCFLRFCWMLLQSGGEAVRKSWSPLSLSRLVSLPPAPHPNLPINHQLFFLFHMKKVLPSIDFSPLSSNVSPVVSPAPLKLPQTVPTIGSIRASFSGRSSSFLVRLVWTAAESWSLRSHVTRRQDRGESVCMWASPCVVTGVSLLRSFFPSLFFFSISLLLAML